ncbi:MAG: ribosome silencing factor [Deltaproteobacteria bacterium]|nr:ribosome silencing factor [Deltaproteobacteria bacterium]
MKELWHQIVDALEEKKARNLVVLDVRGICSFAEYIIIANGMSDRQIKAMAEHVIDTQGKPSGAEGLDLGRWVLLDYIEVIVHIFQDDLRQYYDLDGMWMEAKRLVG